MNLLLDTHTLLWWLADDPGLAASARDAIADGDNRVLVSAASAWEISIKQALGKLVAPPGLEEALEESDLEPLPIGMNHALAAGALPPHHADPFDRMLTAQALIEDAAVITRDPRFADYGVRIIDA
jgi:PIN domain nuclease of toxin-antitoxin system